MGFFTHIAKVLAAGYIVSKGLDKGTEAMKKDIERMKAERAARKKGAHQKGADVTPDTPDA